MESLCPALTTPTRFRLLILKPSGSDAKNSAADSPNFTFTQNVTQISVDKVTGRTASLTVAVTKLMDDSATVSIAGATVVSAADGTGAALPVVNSGVTIANDATITFQINDLHNGSIITVTAEGKKRALRQERKRCRLRRFPANNTHVICHATCIGPDN